jgi:hypothetical protein
MSPLFVLGEPNFPAMKNGTEVPEVGTLSESVFEKRPDVPFRKTTAALLDAAGVKESLIGTKGVSAPVGSVTRIRQGEGVHDTKRARVLVLLLICNSTFIVISF